MTMHREDWAAAGRGVVAWFQAHPNVGLVVAGVLAGIVVTLVFTWG